ncbi:hypothetical protein GGR56DRAFT_163894 [Xylariaceae sp. FL0804]|nr:hypothetical protein GGR56DRAFT_163894 [Xylariaceae sp. FL0804]
MLWSKLQALRGEVADEKDQDGWSIEHHIRQAVGRVTCVASRRLVHSFKTSRKMTIPPMWQCEGMDASSHVTIDDHGRNIHFNADPDCKSLSLRADHPFAPRPYCSNDPNVVYYEIAISAAEQKCTNSGLSERDEGETEPAVAIGLCGEFSDLTGFWPGWSVWTTGYHGDEGAVFEVRHEKQYDTGHTYGPGNVVGCGVDYRTGEYFFTLDGREVGEWLRDPDLLIGPRMIWPAGLGETTLIDA